MMCPTELEVERIHACLKDCILYRDTYANIHRCPICKESRLKQLFANDKDAKLLRWHSDEHKKDGKLRHVADSPQWRKINNKHDEFGGEIRNIRFGLSSDGMNPFGNMSSKHSTWPVLLCVYNIPPWLCTKRKYIRMSFLIEGPKQPDNDIDVYLAPLIDDLKTLWNKGVKVYDAYKKENFTLRAMIFCTISDFPVYNNLSGYSTKGYVRNWARPEGSIVTGYLAEELIEFSNDVVKGVGNIGIPHSRHEGRLSGVGTIGLRMIDPDRDALKVAHSVVLQHVTCITPYIEQHKQMFCVTHRGRTNKWYQSKHNEEFSYCLKDIVMTNLGQPTVEKAVERLGEGLRCWKLSYK
ncbi:hypothetical protein Tco_0836602 [Tanacetum coccineum]